MQMYFQGTSIHGVKYLTLVKVKSINWFITKPKNNAISIATPSVAIVN